MAIQFWWQSFIHNYELPSSILKISSSVPVSSLMMRGLKVTIGSICVSIESCPCCPCPEPKKKKLRKFDTYDREDGSISGSRRRPLRMALFLSSWFLRFPLLPDSTSTRVSLESAELVELCDEVLLKKKF